MFETLHTITALHAERAADVLYRDGQCAFLVDPCGVHLLLTATPDKPYEVDFAAIVLLENAWIPAPLTTLQFSILHEWTQNAIPRICRKWKVRHPDGARAPAPEPHPIKPEEAT